MDIQRRAQSSVPRNLAGHLLSSGGAVALSIGLLIAFLYCPAVARGEEEASHGEEHHEETGEEQSPQRRAPPSFGRYRSEYKKFAIAIVADGRRADLEGLVRDRLDYTAPCRECRAFFKDMIAALKNAKHTQEKDVAKQREPSLEAIQRTVDFALALSSGKNPKDEIVVVARDWLYLFNEGPTTSPAAKEYFAILGSYLEAAFRETLKEAPHESVASPTPTLSFPDKDQFFDF